MLMESGSGQTGLSLEFLEGSLTMAGILLALAFPRTGAAQFQAIERFFAAIALRRRMSILLVGLSAIVLRVALLPLLPAPLPFTPNDFSFLLSADTFLHGRLTNPTPALWMHFETIHVTMLPTYNSMYFPAVGLLLAASKIVFGHPWFGLLGVAALMCAAICWMLQAWVPPQWALLGGLLAVVHLGVFSYWVNSYTGGGSIAALGGALILGPISRMLRVIRVQHLMLMATGIILVGFTRPYEGTLLCVPVLARLVVWLKQGRDVPSRGVLLRTSALPLALVVGAVYWLGYYDYRNFGNPTTLPYTVDRATYAIAPYFIWQKPRPEPHYRHESIREFYEDEARQFYPASSAGVFLKGRLLMAVGEVRFFCGLALLPVLLGLPLAVLDRRIRVLSVLLLILLLGFVPAGYVIPHYLAPFTAVMYGIGIQGMRHLRVWRRDGGAPGLSLLRMSILICAVIAILRPFDKFLGMPVRGPQSSDWNFTWYGPDHFGTERADMERRLGELPGKQLVLVHYAKSHLPLNEWVYNSADIDTSKVIWAHDMGPAENLDLIHAYANREVWIVDPDQAPVGLAPYTSAARSSPRVVESTLKGAGSVAGVERQ